jgi:tRNA pseudouridine55 synthase
MSESSSPVLPTAISGILLVDKPVGVSSFQALYPIKRALGAGGKRGTKIGHAGTLDPAASGLLLLGIGAGTRLLEFLEGMPKSYRFALHLGITTDTYDLDGEILTRADASSVTREQIEALLPRFHGDIEQTPPVYSAIKVDGKRAYERARAGEMVEMVARPVHVSRLEIVEFRPGHEGVPPTALLELDCSKGTYVRTIAHDLGALLGCGAVAAQIRRTAIGPFRVEDAVAPEAAQASDLAPVETAVSHLASVAVKPEWVDALRHGHAVPPAGYRALPRRQDARAASLPVPDPAVCAIYSTDDVLLAVGDLAPTGQLQPRKVFPA